MTTPASDPRRLRGIFTPNIVPLDEKGEIHEAEYRRYIDWLIDRGVHGLYPNGSTGEFTRFTAEERRRTVRIMVDQTRGRVPILAGAAEANVKETLSACEYYAGLGVRAVAIVSPFYYKLGPEGVYAYFREIGRNTPIDVTLYNIPLFASPIDVPTVQRLSEECERIIAIKDSSGDVPHMMRMIQAVRPNRPEFSFLTGWDAALMPMLLVGADGGTNATSGVVPEMTRSLYDLTVSGRLEVALQIQYDLVTLFDHMLFKSEFPEGFRAAVELRGFRFGQGRSPMSEKQRAELSQLREKLRSLLGERGFLDLQTSSPSSRAPDMSEIVRDVVSELKRRGLVS
ncbi:dihydrodipicolinate synthase family protein [Planctomicrobium piriforme]|uniref:4-hydroxy-tetrahydrodipicolinate synthase n=1 Tax=Planctomicrobium piriforme TaxID=1576369 RepID=A0A1I3QB17_9PLAN|nr:dihydrodipicolinate synthase family protein [Planctomicrobium piriforme]SFJ30732.1 4-hydroxy-tetrahydrodipicolinate synthase [Planctomicrobium piriforme]